MGLFVVLVKVLFEFRRSLPVLVVGCLVAVVLLNLPGGQNLTERFTTSDHATANGRLLLWETTVQGIVNASPVELLLGHGFDSNKAFLSRVSVPGASTQNSYLQILFEFGLLGFGLFMALHAWIIRACWRYRDELSLYALGMVTFLLFSSLSVTATDWLLYWVVLGHVLAVSVWRNADQSDV